MQKFMEAAREELAKNVANAEGGPFGAVVVKDGQIVGRGHNLVTSTFDPTAHGEVSAIRDATKNLQTFDLSDCELYTTAYPCPMCLGAIFRAKIPKVIYTASLEETKKAGFDDDVMYQEFLLPDEQKSVKIIHEYDQEVFPLMQQRKSKYLSEEGKDYNRK